jgi:hypothetical protein
VPTSRPRTPRRGHMLQCPVMMGLQRATAALCLGCEAEGDKRARNSVSAQEPCAYGVAGRPCPSERRFFGQVRPLRTAEDTSPRRFSLRACAGYASALRSRSRGLQAAPGHRVPAGGLRRHTVPGGDHALDAQQLPRSSRRNPLPVKRINGSLLMSHEHLSRALIELMQMRKTPAGADRVLHDTPEAFDGIEVVATMSR